MWVKNEVHLRADGRRCCGAVCLAAIATVTTAPTKYLPHCSCCLQGTSVGSWYMWSCILTLRLALLGCFSVSMLVRLPVQLLTPGSRAGLYVLLNGIFSLFPLLAGDVLPVTYQWPPTPLQQQRMVSQYSYFCPLLVFYKWANTRKHLEFCELKCAKF